MGFFFSPSIDYCAECTYLKETPSSYGKYWCTKKGEDHYADDSVCGRECKAYNRSDSCISNMISYSKNNRSTGGCYITTILCEILNMPDNNIFLTELREFRENYMKSSLLNILILQTYDTYGPTIAKMINNDANKNELASHVLTRYLYPAVSCILEGEYEAAKMAYIDMTNWLCEHYGIYFNIDTKINTSNYSNLGHGRVKTKNI